MSGVVVVGASVGGVATVSALRSMGFDDEITLVDSDATALYDRPPLSKQVLVEGTALDSIQLVDPATFEEYDVHLRLGAPAVRLDVASRQLALEGGETLGFEHLVIATGSVPRVLPGMRERPGLHLLRTYDDAIRLRHDLMEGGRLVVIGGGMIGLEVASSARKLGVDVTVVEPLQEPMRRVVGPALGPYLISLLRSEGVDFRAGTMVTSLLGDRICEGVELDTGERVIADATLVSIGTSPATAWLMGTALELDDGVVCDETCAASGADKVFAVGDVCRWLNPRYGRLVRSENWTSAQEQAGIVASAIMGEPRRLDQVPYVWSDQFGRRIQVLGLPNEGSVTRIFVDESSGEPIALYFDESDQLIGVVAVDQARLVGQARRALMRGTGAVELIAKLENTCQEAGSEAWKAPLSS